MAFTMLHFTALINFLFAAALATNVPFGGADSTALYEGDVIITAPAPIPSDVGSYDSVWSSIGLASFCNGTFAVAASDYSDGAMGGLTSSFCPHYTEVTLPQVLDSVSFGVYNASSTLNLTAAQIWGIYNGTIRSWSSIPGAHPLNGTIKPIGRLDEAGETLQVTSWLYKSKTSIPASQGMKQIWS